jgi:hypothetical protein
MPQMPYGTANAAPFSRTTFDTAEDLFACAFRCSMSSAHAESAAARLTMQQDLTPLIQQAEQVRFWPTVGSLYHALQLASDID